MKEIKCEQKIILELIKNVLFQIKPKFLEDADWGKVYEIAKEQCIVALLEPAIPKEYRPNWSEKTCQSISQYLKVTYEQNELVRLFHENGISMVILKGTAAAMYYPEPYRRTMGDIDLLIPTGVYAETKELLKKTGYSFVREDSRHCEYGINGVDIEVHRQFSSKYYKDIEHILNKGMENIREYDIIHNSFPGLPPAENGLVLLGHMMQHIHYSGLGLRQVIDWMMYVHKELDDESWEKNFKSLAMQAGLEKLAITITFMCRKWLGLPSDITWCNDADEELADLIILQIFADGNFGFLRPLSIGVRDNIRNEGIFVFLQREGKANWTLAQRFVIFRPFAWIYQVFRYIGKGIAALFRGKNELRGIKDARDIEMIKRRLE